MEVRPRRAARLADRAEQAISRGLFFCSEFLERRHVRKAARRLVKVNAGERDPQDVSRPFSESLGGFVSYA